MADVKWIKITTDMFDNRKIKHLRRLPDGNSIVLIWVMLLTMAGRCNAGGMIFLTENIPYTPKMLADELDFEENTVKLALGALEQFNMIVCNNGYFAISGWEEHQNVDGLEKIREQNRLRKQRQRENQKLLENVSRDITGQVTQCHATDIEEDKEKEKKKNIDYIQIKD
jgi:predicted phage replisome organizer